MGSVRHIAEDLVGVSMKLPCFEIVFHCSVIGTVIQFWVTRYVVGNCIAPKSLPILGHPLAINSISTLPKRSSTEYSVFKIAIED